MKIKKNIEDIDCSNPGRGEAVHCELHHSRSIKHLYPRIIMTAILAATVISFYRMALSMAHDLRHGTGKISGLFTRWNGFLGGNYKPASSSDAIAHAMDNVALLAVVIILLGALVGLIVEKVPGVRGSGVPRVVATMDDESFKNNPIRELLAKFFTSVSAIFAGVAIGSEGPSIHMGGMVGEKVSQVTNCDHEENEFIVGTGAIAGFAAAFNIPLAALFFAQEELFHRFTRRTLIVTTVAVLIADFVAKIWMTIFIAFDQSLNINAAFEKASSPVFSMIKLLEDNVLTLGNFFLAMVVVVLFSVIIACIGKFYKSGSFKLREYTNKMRPGVRVGISFLLAIPVLLLIPEAISSAYIFLKYTGTDAGIAYQGLFQTEVWMLVLIATIVFFYSMYNVAVGFPGGTLVPFMVIGGLLGLALGRFMGEAYSMNDSQMIVFSVALMLSGMAAMIGAIGRTPLMAVALVLETTGALPLILLIFVAAVVSDFIEGLFKNDKALAIYGAEAVLGHEIHH